MSFQSFYSLIWSWTQAGWIDLWIFSRLIKWIFISFPYKIVWILEKPLINFGIYIKPDFSDSLDFQWTSEVDIHFIFVQNGMDFIETSHLEFMHQFLSPTVRMHVAVSS